MASRDLEAPPGIDPVWDELYVARGDDVLTHRPIYTGDVFSNVKVRTTLGLEKVRPVMVIQHPCTMRSGAQLKDSLLVARVHQFGALPRDQWHTNGKLMPLPQLYPNKTSNQAHQAAFFEELYLVHPTALELDQRVACLSEVGSYLLLQRWDFHSSRLAPPVWQIEQTNSHVYSEADLIESWCEAALDASISLAQAGVEADAWFSQSNNGTTRRDMLRTSSLRSQVQREMKEELKRRYGPSATVITFGAGFV
jgi:hypothetical protein